MFGVLEAITSGINVAQMPTNCALTYLQYSMFYFFLFEENSLRRLYQKTEWINLKIWRMGFVHWTQTRILAIICVLFVFLEALVNIYLNLQH